MSSATRPFSAVATPWPRSSRLRVRSRRFTRLSSATRRRAGLLIAQVLERGRDAAVLGEDGLERSRSACRDRHHAGHLEVAREIAQFARAEGIAVGLERVRRAAKAVG